MELYEPTNTKSVIAIILVVLYVIINFNVAWNTYRYAKKLETEKNSKLAFIDSALWIPISILFGLPIAILLGFIESRK